MSMKKYVKNSHISRSTYSNAVFLFGTVIVFVARFSSITAPNPFLYFTLPSNVILFPDKTSTVAVKDGDSL